MTTSTDNRGSQNVYDWSARMGDKFREKIPSPNSNMLQPYLRVIFRKSHGFDRKYGLAPQPAMRPYAPALEWLLLFLQSVY